MIVRLWMTRDPLTVAPETPIAEAAALMAARSVRRLPVMTGSGEGARLAGIITTHDLARAFPPDLNPFAAGSMERGPRGPVSSIMSTALRTVSPETPIEEAARILRDGKIGALPVVESDHLAGIITESDIFRAFIEILGARSDGVRVTFEAGDGQDPVAAMVDLGRKHGLRMAAVMTLDHGGRRLVAVRLQGPPVCQEAFVAAVWKSGHRVLNVLRPGEGAASSKAQGAGAGSGRPVK